jgi:hypothetical protein
LKSLPSYSVAFQPGATRIEEMQFDQVRLPTEKYGSSPLSTVSTQGLRYPRRNGTSLVTSAA